MCGAYMLFASYFLFCGTFSLSDVRFALPGQMDFMVRRLLIMRLLPGGAYKCMHACMHGRWLFWGCVRLCRFDVGRWRWVALKFGTSYLCLCSEGGFLWFQGGVLGWKGERAD